MQSNKKMLNISCLGRYGFFGNQLFQYAFARAYALKTGCVLHTPKWLGQKIFVDSYDPPIYGNLKCLGEDVIPVPANNSDLIGYFQGNKHLKYYDINFAKRIYKIKPEIIEILEKGMTDIPKNKIACHVRHGDYLTKYSHIYCVIQEEAYIKAVENMGYKESDILWIRSEQPHINPELPDEMSFLQDFYIMMKSPLLLRSNSTFSWWASVLGDAKTFSPLVDDKNGLRSDIEFIESNRPKILNRPPNHTDFELRGMK